jgi:hypothetical protein
MRTLRLGALALMTISLAALAADQPKLPAAPTNPMWEQMKKLEGKWTTKAGEGTATTTYHLTSGGSALLMVVQVPGEGEMTTIFHPVGNTVIGTHYCLSMNQPTFVASPGADPSVIAFKFKSVDNLKTPATGHMRTLTLKIDDYQHHSQVWSYREKGKDSLETFAAVRSK